MNEINNEKREKIIKKIISLVIDKINEYENLFTDEEKEIIAIIFEIANMYKKKQKEQLEKYKNIEKREKLMENRTINFLENVISNQNEINSKSLIKHII